MLYDLTRLGSLLPLSKLALSPFSSKNTPDPWILIGFSHYLCSRQFWVCTFQREFLLCPSGEIYTCSKRHFTFSAFISIVNLPNAILLLRLTRCYNVQRLLVSIISQHGLQYWASGNRSAYSWVIALAIATVNLLTAVDKLAVTCCHQAKGYAVRRGLGLVL